MPFVPLFVRSSFSYLRSSLKVDEIPFLAAKKGLSCCSIVDTNLAGYCPFAHAAKKAGIKPIYGYEAVVGNDESVLLYVQSEEGYRELLRLSYLESKRALSKEDLVLPFKGLLSVFPYLKGAAVPEGIDYIGLPYGLDEEEKREARKSYGPKLVALPLIACDKEKNQVSLRLLRSVAENKPMAEVDDLAPEHWLDEKEINAYYRPEEVALTEKIAAICCDFSLIRKRGTLLKFPVPDGESDESYLRKLSLEGLRKRKGQVSPEYQKRLDYELSVINKMGYASYFLIVNDYVSHAKSIGISVGPGRGSAAGSLVAYALHIVEPDPLEHGLIFERFLNIERQTMPDIDIDFSDIRRNEVVDYLIKRYPGARVARVLTTQTIGAREAIRDAGKSLGYREEEISLISSSLDPRMSLEDNYRSGGNFKSLVDHDDYIIRLVGMASKIQGLPRQRGIHAAGVVIDENPLPEVAPCRKEAENGLVVNIEKDYLEEQGFLKFDLLGLRNLSLLDLILELVKKDSGKSLGYEDLDINDKEAIAVVASGRTVGLFQLESAGMKRTLREVEPTSFADVAAILALYRPGPMKSIPSFARRKKGLEKVTYPAKELAPILDETYGIIVYQEQIMLLAEAYAGYSFGEADVLRRAISKKNQEVMKEGRSAFVRRAVEKGHPEAEAMQVYNLIERFASYGFNKSHAVSYAYVAMYLAYLKAHYPAAFYAGYLSTVGQEKFNPALAEMRELNLSLASPSIDGPYFAFVPKNGKIALPLSSIHGLSSSIIKAIAEERKKGPFKDIYDLARRLLSAGLKQQDIVALIDAGALDLFGETRSTLRGASYQAIKYAQLFGGESGMECLLELNIAPPSLIRKEAEPLVDMDAEKEAIGMLLSVSPFLPYKEEIERKHALPLAEGVYKDRALVYAAVESVKAIETKAGKKMAFVSLGDETFHGEGIAFQETYTALYPLLKVGTPLLLAIERDRRQEGKFIIKSAERLRKEE